LHPVQTAFIEHHALQCGFCTPGFLMLTVNALETNPDLTDEDILDLLSSNLCRCTGYQNIVKAVRSTVAEMRRPPARSVCQTNREKAPFRHSRSCTCGRKYQSLLVRAKIGTDPLAVDSHFRGNERGGTRVPIDVHAHYVPPQLIDAVATRGKDVGVQLVPSAGAPPALHFDYGFKVRPFFPRLVESVAERRAWLDAQGIDRQIVGTWPDIFGYGLAPDACVVWHRMLNDTLAAWCADNSDRFAWIASVPLIRAEAAAEEAERAASLGAIGVIISSNIENVNLGELPLDAVWRRLEPLDLPVLIHPVLAAPAPRAAKFALAQVAQYTFDPTLGIGSVLMSGVLDRFPRLKLVLAHGGGAYPYLAGRF